MSAYNADQVPDLLGPAGPLAGELAAYEDRPFQRELALEVARLLDDGGRLAAEAPTGIGKSLGYALPAAAWAAAGHGPAVISTHTKALQEQLLTLEAPRLRRAVSPELRVEVLKGRANYLCRRRYQAARREASGEGTARLLDRLRPWTESTRTGDFGECGERNPRDLQFLFLRVGSDPRFCAHPGCTPASGCFFKIARNRAAAADLLVVNHALLAVHLFGEGDVLPAFEALVVDEAHAFLRVALDHLTVSAGPARAAALADASPGSGGLVPGAVRAGEGASRLAALHRSTAALDAAFRGWFGRKNGARPTGDDRRRYRDPGELAALCPLSADPLTGALGTLLADARALESFVDREGGGGEDEEGFLTECGRFAEEIESLRRDLDDLLHPDPADRDRVQWKEWGGEEAFSLNAAPLEIGPRLAGSLREGPERLVFTSATLAAGRDFGYFARETGLGESLHTVAYPSPFDFTEQALAVAVRRAPDPRDPSWPEATAATLDGLLRDPGRKTLALFTSYRDLENVREALERRLAAGRPMFDPFAKPGETETPPDPYQILAQGSGGTASDLLQRFRRSPRAVLLGTASFWEGVDLPGEDLEVLVLTRLPFGVPTEPRLQARSERLEAEGGNPFLELYLPDAVLRFKQGFGRLIRRRSDRGIVAVLDPRIVTKNYGRRFSGALPLPLTVVPDGPALVAAAGAWWRSHRPGPEAGTGGPPVSSPSEEGDPS